MSIKELLFCVVFILRSEDSSCRIVLGSSDFQIVRNSSAFVDKTLLIKEFFNHDYLIINAPCRFGKSVSLDMISVFLGNHRSKSIIEAVFRDTHISNDKQFMQKHLGTHPVIHCNLKPAANVNNFESMVAAFRSSLHLTFLEHKYLLHSKELTEELKREFDRYADVRKSLHLRIDQILYGLKLLSELLNRHYGKKVILLIDDYDNIIIESIFQAGLDTIKAVSSITTLISVTLKDNDLVERAILTGITSYLSTGFLDGLNNVERCKFLDDNIFTPYYGFTAKEINGLFNRKEFEALKKIEHEIAAWYGGYACSETETRVYNPWSVLTFLERKQMVNYWTDTGIVHRLNFFLTFPQISDSIVRLVNYECILIAPKIDLHVTAIEQLKKYMIKQSLNETAVDESIQDTYFLLLLETGYLTFAQKCSRHGNIVYVRVPNEEIRAVFQQELLTVSKLV